MNVTRFIHVNVVVKDLDRSLELYSGLLGGTVLEHLSANDQPAALYRSMGLPQSSTDNFRAALVYFGGAKNGPYIDLVEWSTDEPHREEHQGFFDHGLVRIALEVDDLERYEKKIRDFGIEPCGPIEIVPIGPWLSRLLFFRDPDGTIIELIDFPEGY